MIFAYCVLAESNPRVLARKNKKKDDTTMTTQDAADVDVRVNINSPKTPPKSPTDDLKIAGGHGRGDGSLSNKLPFEIYVIGTLNILNMMGWTSYTSMFAYYLIIKYNINTLAVGYITLSMATLYVFTNIVIFSQLSKKIGVYLCVFFGLIIFCIFLALLPSPNNLWLTLSCMAIGSGIGNAIVFPAMPAMAADYTNPTNRGKLLAFVEGTRNLGMVLGPMFHGVVFEINPDLVFYCSSAFVATAWLCIVFLLIRDPKLRHAKKKLKINKDEGIEDDNEDDWRWIPDIPNDRDFRRLGTFLGKLLIKRNYNWVSHFEPLTQFLKDIFPPTRTTSLKDHIEDIQFLRAGISNLRNEYDAVHAELNVGYS